MATSLVTGSNLAAQVKDYKTDPHQTQETKNFLNAINTGGPGLETLPVKDAQNVLASIGHSSFFANHK